MVEAMNSGHLCDVATGEVNDGSLRIVLGDKPPEHPQTVGVWLDS